jgi:hypothetical protein
MIHTFWNAIGHFSNNTQRPDFVEIKQLHRPDLFKLLTDEKVIKYYNLKSLNCEKDAEKYIEWFNCRYIDNLGIRWGIVLKGTRNIEFAF